MKLYFDCTNGISGDMSVASLLDLGADKEILNNALNSLKLDEEFSYQITNPLINSIKATDFNVILKHTHNHHHNNNHHHHHRNLEDVIKIIDNAEISQKSKELAKKIFNIVAKAEAKVHNKPLNEIHFHEVGAIDSIVDIIAFSVLFDSLNVDEVYFSTLSEGIGCVKCQHGVMNVPAPAVCEILSEYNIPIKITQQEGEMITPTGVAIVAALYGDDKIFDKEFVIKKVGYGAGKRPYKNPVLRVMVIEK